MLFFRSKNAKIITLIAAILIIVVCIYAKLVDDKDEENKKETIETPSSVQKILEHDYDKNYPASVREVVKTYCKVIENLYNEDLSEDAFIELADVERELLDEELLENNTYSEFMGRLRKEIKTYKDASTKITKWEVEENKSVKYWYNDNKRCSSINVSIQLSGQGGIINERFILRLDKSGKWRILGWEEASKDNSEGKEGKKNGK